MKPHTFAQMVNEVRDLARQYGQVEQFRCRVADLLGKYIHVEHNSKGMPEQTEAQAVVVPDLEDGDDAWQDAAFKGVNYSAGLRDGYNLAKSRACAIPADRVLGEAEVKVPGSCVWSKVDIQDERNWSTTCQHVWSFEDGGPSENNANFCPFCGGQIEVELDSGSNQGGVAT